MSQPFTILFAPFRGIGHVNPAIGIAQQLLARGHKVVFVVERCLKGKLEPLGFHVCYLEGEDEVAVKELRIKRFEGLASILAMEPIEQIEHTHIPFYRGAIQKTKSRDAELREVMAAIKPDVIVVDLILQCPALVDQGVPWVFMTAFNPMTISSRNVPPFGTGYQITNGDPAEWKKFTEKQRLLLTDLFQDFKSWVLSKGGPELKYDDNPFWHKYSPYANLYNYPMELSYRAIRPDPPNWYGFDAFLRMEPGHFEIPPEIENKPGKLIYFTMGTIDCHELTLMKRLISILGNSPNRFILSKGGMGDELELELPSNMWGASFLPQTSIIPLVDLVVCHAGTNTITESFYFGKPILTLPLMVDQTDNAQRIYETGHGLRFHPYHVTQDQLLSGIENLLADELLKRRMKSISKRMQSSNSQARAADVIEDVAKGIL